MVLNSIYYETIECKPRPNLSSQKHTGDLSMQAHSYDTSTLLRAVVSVALRTQELAATSL